MAKFNLFDFTCRTINELSFSMAYRNAVRTLHHFNATTNNHRSIPNLRRNVREFYSGLASKTHCHPRTAGFCTGVEHPIHCRCCHRQPQPLPPKVSTLSLHRQKRTFTAKTSKDGDGEESQPTKEKFEGSALTDHSLEVTESITNDLGIPGAQKGGKKLAIVFTCNVCNTRAAKQFTENSYLNGVVIVQCPGCNSRHLIADNLGFFSDEEEGGWNIEKAMAKLGENVNVVNDDNVLELSVEDIYGKEAINKASEPTGEDSTNEGKASNS